MNLIIYTLLALTRGLQLHAPSVHVLLVPDICVFFAGANFNIYMDSLGLRNSRKRKPQESATKAKTLSR